MGCGLRGDDDQQTVPTAVEDVIVGVWSRVGATQVGGVPGAGCGVVGIPLGAGGA